MLTLSGNASVNLSYVFMIGRSCGMSSGPDWVVVMPSAGIARAISTPADSDGRRAPAGA